MELPFRKRNWNRKHPFLKKKKKILLKHRTFPPKNNPKSMKTAGTGTPMKTANSSITTRTLKLKSMKTADIGTPTKKANNSITTRTLKPKSMKTADIGTPTKTENNSITTRTRRLKNIRNNLYLPMIFPFLRRKILPNLTKLPCRKPKYRLKRRN